MTDKANPRSAAARAFVRSLNILIKFARMYELGHPRTARQHEIAWTELHAALGLDDDAGLLLAVSGDQLLIDGTPIESAAAEKSFARMLSGAGIASIHFSPKVTQQSLTRFVRGFPTGTSSKPAQLAQQLKSALEGDPHIHVNEVCFVPADSAVAKSTVAAHLAVRTLGMSSEQTEELFKDPEKLLQMIVAAEGATGKGPGLGPGLGPDPGSGPGETSGSSFYSGEKGDTADPAAILEGPGAVLGTGTATGDASSGIRAPGSEALREVGAGTGTAVRGDHPAGGSLGPSGPSAGHISRWTHASAGIRGARPARGGPGSMAVETGLMTLQEDELQGILQVLAQIARTSDKGKERLDMGAFQSRLSTVPRRARFTITQALSALAAQSPEVADRSMLLKLAEHIAVRFALEKYNRGDLQVNAVQEMLDDMSREIDALRKVLGVYEDGINRAGLHLQSPAEILAQQFWSQVPDEKKKEVLQSEDAWSIPPARVREYVENLLAQGDKETAASALRNYASFIKSSSPDSRRSVAMGVSELAPLYAKGDEKLLIDTIREIGLQIAAEQDSALQSLMGAAFVRLSQEASQNRSFPAMQRSVELVDYIETERPGTGKSLRPRISVENRLPDFIEDSLRSGEIPEGLKDLMRRVPQVASEQIAVRYSRVGFREDSEILIAMMQALGPEALEQLKLRLEHGPVNDAIEAVGILTRMDIAAVARLLPGRVKDWKRLAHDRVVRQIAASGAQDRGQLLLDLFDALDPLIQPLAIDEIGMTGEKTADMRLLRIAEGDLPPGATSYLRLKAIEALGRLRVEKAETVLRNVLEARKAWRWFHPSELRLVAAQALEKLDSDWARGFIPNSGLSAAEFSIEILDSDPNSSAIRQRRYPRLRLEHPVSATTTNLRENCRIEIPEMALGGGVAVCDQSLHPGSVVEIRLNSEKPVRAQTIVRDANTQARAFEVVDMDLDERAKLRRLLVQLGSSQKSSTPQERVRRGTRTIHTGGG
jgi:hypothetical protein